MVECKICNKECRSIGCHVYHAHGMRVIDYKRQYNTIDVVERRNYTDIYQKALITKLNDLLNMYKVKKDMSKMNYVVVFWGSKDDARIAAFAKKAIDDVEREVFLDWAMNKGYVPFFVRQKEYGKYSMCKKYIRNVEEFMTFTRLLIDAQNS